MKVLPNADTLLVTNPTNIRYLTGFVGVDARDAYVLLTKNKTFFFTNSLYMEQTKTLSPIQISQDYPISTALKKLCEELNIKKLGFEEENVTVSEFNKFQTVLTGIALVPTKNRIEEQRQIKKPQELENIRLAVRITDQCFKFISRRIRPGITESRLALEIEGFIRAKGGELAFPPIVAFNEHSSQPHYASVRSYSPLRSGSLVLLDFGANVNGYNADMTRIVFVGKPKREWVLAYTTVLQAQEKAFDLLKDGVRNGATLDAAAKEIIAEADLPPYTHSLGHNIGLSVHEGPRLSSTKEATLMPGMVFSVEPGVYLEGQYGIRIEDLVLLKKDGIEVLTKSPKNI